MGMRIFFLLCFFAAWHLISPLSSAFRLLALSALSLGLVSAALVNGWRVSRFVDVPGIADGDYTDDELLYLLRYENDSFTRWEVSQRLAMRRLLDLSVALQGGAALETFELDRAFIKAHRAVLSDTTIDPALREAMFCLPSEGLIAEGLDVVDPQTIHAARQFMRRELAQALKAELLEAYDGNLIPGPYTRGAEVDGKRALKNLALSYLLELPDHKTLQLVQTQFENADNLADRSAALMALINIDEECKAGGMAAAKALESFYTLFENQAPFIDRWFMLQASSNNTDVAALRKLMRHPAFALDQPNRARCVILAFCVDNPFRFHAADGSGYVFWAEQVPALDAINPRLAARIARSLEHWRKYLPPLRVNMERALRHVAAGNNLSHDVREIIDRALFDQFDQFDHILLPSI